MIRLLLPAALLLALVLFIRHYSRADSAKRKRMMAGFLFTILFGFVLFLTITGRLHFIAAIVTGLLPFVKKALPFLQYVPILKRFVKQNKDGVENEGQNRGARNDSSRLTRAQALQVLGLKDGASKEEVVEAHRRLMQRCHPDRGGNDFLAAQLNAAKETLLG